MINYGEYTVCLLDRFRVERSGEPVEQFEYRKREELFAFLMLRGRIPIPQAELTSVLWPTVSETAGANRLYETAFRMREQLQPIGLDEDVIQISRGYVLPHPALGRDIDHLNRLCELAITEPRSADEPIIPELRRVYGEGLLPGLRAPWLDAERSRLRARYEQAIGTAMVRQPSTSVFPLGQTEPAPTKRPEDRHAELMALADNMWANRFGVDREYWFEVVDLHAKEIRETIAWALEHNAKIALDLAGHFWVYWYFRGQHSTGQRYVDEALAFEHGRGSDISRAFALNGSAIFASREGGLEQAEQRLSEALAIWERIGDQERYACTVHDQMNLARKRGDKDLAIALGYKSLEFQRRAGHSESITKRLIDVAAVEREFGSLDRSRALLDEARERSDESAAWLQARIHEAFGLLLMHRRGHGDAIAENHRQLETEVEQELRTAIDLLHTVRSHELEAYSTRFLGNVLHWQHRYEEAQAAYEHARDLAAVSGDFRNVGGILRDLADLLAAQEHWEQAEQLAQQSVSLFRAVSDHIGENEALELHGHIRRRGLDPST